MRNLRRLTAGIAAACALAFGGMAVHDAVAPTPAHAWSFYGSCGWSTDGAWHYSPYLGKYYRYAGHTMIGGHNYRLFATYGYLSGAFSGWVVVYCG